MVLAIHADDAQAVCAHLLRCIPRACRPRSVMTYNVFRSLCGCFVTYCTSTKRTSPVLEANALTMRPPLPPPAMLSRTKISSLVKSMVIHDPICDYVDMILVPSGAGFRLSAFDCRSAR